MSERTAVYRLYDADDVLIYVGVTRNTTQRWAQHAQLKSWWRQGVRREVTWLDSRSDALLAERRAVLAVLDESKASMPEADAVARRRWAVVFAARIGWSKYQIASELGISPSVAASILIASRRDGDDRPPRLAAAPSRRRAI